MRSAPFSRSFNASLCRGGLEGVSATSPLCIDVVIPDASPRYKCGRPAPRQPEARIRDIHMCVGVRPLLDQQPCHLATRPPSSRCSRRSRPAFPPVHSRWRLSRPEWTWPIFAVQHPARPPPPRVRIRFGAGPRGDSGGLALPDACACAGGPQRDRRRGVLEGRRGRPGSVSSVRAAPIQARHGREAGPAS